MRGSPPAKVDGVSPATDADIPADHADRADDQLSDVGGNGHDEAADDDGGGGPLPSGLS